MVRVRRAAERGFFDQGWLRTSHTFSFGEYRDPAHRGFRGLRVINEDVIAPGQGFGLHPHHDMEIVTLVLSGALEHRDSLGHGAIVRPGELQRMTAGTGILHSEFNPSSSEPVHLYQIWIFPAQRGLTPSYDQRRFSDQRQPNSWQCVAAPAGANFPDGANEALRIQADARIELADLTPGSTISQTLAAGRGGWLQVLSGSVQCGAERWSAGDGVAVESGSEAETVLELRLTTDSGASLLWFDLA